MFKTNVQLLWTKIRNACIHACMHAVNVDSINSFNPGQITILQCLQDTKSICAGSACPWAEGWKCRQNEDVVHCFFYLIPSAMKPNAPQTCSKHEEQNSLTAQDTGYLLPHTHTFNSVCSPHKCQLLMCSLNIVKLAECPLHIFLLVNQSGNIEVNTCSTRLLLLESAFFLLPPLTYLPASVPHLSSVCLHPCVCTRAMCVYVCSGHLRLDQDQSQILYERTPKMLKCIVLILSK